MAEQNNTELTQKFITDNPPSVAGGQQMSHLFVYQKDDAGSVGALAYTPSLDANGQPIPLTQESFYERLSQHDTDIGNNIADSVGIPRKFLAGAINYRQDRSTLLEQVKPNIEERFKHIAQSNPIVASEAGTAEPNQENAPSYAPAIKALMIANILDSQSFADYDNMTDKDIRRFAEEYIKHDKGETPTDEELNEFVRVVKEFKPTTKYKPSAKVPMSEFKTTSVNNYNAVLRIANNQASYDNWFEHRGTIRDFWDPAEQTEYATLQKSADFFRDPTEHFNTELKEPDEKKYQEWFQDMQDKGAILAEDIGYDYDFRGAFKDGYKPVKQEDGTYHWTDKYKKPNHETFSKESKYATGIWKSFAGEWKGDTFEKPTVSYPRQEQLEYTEYMKAMSLNVPTEHDKTYNPLVTAYKNARRFMLVGNGTVTGFAAPTEADEDLTISDVVDTLVGGVTKNIKVTKEKVHTFFLKQTLIGDRFKGLEGYVSYDGIQNVAYDVKAENISNSVVIPYTDDSSVAQARRAMNKEMLYNFLSNVASDDILLDLLPGRLSTENTQIRKKDVAGAIFYQNTQDQPAYITGVFADEYPELVEMQRAEETAGYNFIQTNLGGNASNLTPQQKMALAENNAPYHQKLLRKTIDVVSTRSNGINPRVFNKGAVDTLNVLLHNPGGEIVTNTDLGGLAHVKYAVGNNPELAYLGAKQLVLDPQYSNDKQGSLKTEGLDTKANAVAINNRGYIRAQALTYYYLLPEFQSVLDSLIANRGNFPPEKMTEKEWSDAVIKARNEIHDELGPIIGVPGEQYTSSNIEMENTLAYLFATIAKTVNTYDNSKKINTVIEQVVANYKANYIVSDKYKTSITRGAAEDIGIKDAKELDYYLTTARRAYLTAIARNMVGSEKIDQQSLAELADVGGVSLYTAGGSVYGYIKDSNGISHIMQIAVKGEPVVSTDGTITNYKMVYGKPFALELPSMKNGHEQSIITFTQQAYNTYPELGKYLATLPLYNDNAALPGVYNPKGLYIGAAPLTADNIVRLSEYIFSDSSDREKNIAKVAELYNNMRVHAKQDIYNYGKLRRNVTDDMIDMQIAESFSKYIEGIKETKAASPASILTPGRTPYHSIYINARRPLTRTWVEKWWQEDIGPTAEDIGGKASKAVKEQKVVTMQDTKKAKEETKKAKEETRNREVQNFNNLYDSIKGGAR